MSLKKHLSTLLCTLLIGSNLLVAQSAKLKEIKPGWNLFSKDQDVQMGKEYAQQIEKQTDVLPPGQLNDYVSQLGNLIATQPQAGGFPYVFKVVNDPNINAFALPGGPIYIHSAVLLNAESEGQIVGVIAHEISHVALRHSTNQVTKANALQIPAMIAGVYGQMKGGLIGTLTQMGVGLGAQSLILKFSRGAESQADLKQRLRDHNQEEIDPRLDPDEEHHESRDDHDQLKPWQEVVPSRRLKHARDDHRGSIARRGTRLKD